ncbi:MAG: hypothetical protein COW01_09555 [Bdellovibrionales bacterium CG12_big_fil_rev_8_21_14_0_65_38_15]|nr:MAG: hypothetical protein COW79_09560 [Bdellovibrionales bacterium CG22_combo_CG10-13_8_21_14_all_38_13]PIQ54773.1 MAG: hypothetical protein COW01_09555 [Bdellovibrionales bacterium CG12_big_fil_rev_8_21_14_0_65_38_15]PIR31328.1 MAG: hypothetical protein COV38_01170 [Bdellovibrionales bacterium CG11_big_fil_rev_8_21_14_0_20_38_13]
MLKLLALFTLFMASNSGYAQDERFIRKLLSGDLGVEGVEENKPKPHFHVASAMYEIDLNSDNRVESIVIEKKDSEDWLHIQNYERQIIYSLKFVRKGWESDVYKINLRKLSDNTHVLLVRYYEGHNQGDNFTGTARLYTISWENNDLTKISSLRGPEIWDEFRDSKIHYHQRPQLISLNDLDGDGYKEISIRHHLSTKVMKYLGKGEWQLR